MVLDVVGLAKGDGDLVLDNDFTLSGIAGDIGDDDDGEDSLDLRGGRSLDPILLTLKNEKLVIHFD